MTTIHVGLRVRIVKAEGKSLALGIVARDPNPQHISKLGTIIGFESVGSRHSTPIIKVDDGAKLRGYECWWEPVGN